MRSTIITFLILSSFAVNAEDADCEDKTIQGIKPVMAVAKAAEEETVCPNPKKLRGLCMFVESKEKDPDPQGRFEWKYQRKLLEAACIDLKKDSEEVIGKKISKVFKDNEKTLICNNTKFDVANGNIVKFAVNLKFDEFLIDVTKWKVDFNKVDDTDGRTVLDYVQAQIERNKGLPTEATLKHYYKILKEAGAKHKSEL